MDVRFFIQSAEKLELYAEAIHHGWYIWMEENGYKYGEERDDVKKTHPHFKIWDELTDAHKESTYASAAEVALAVQMEVEKDAIE